MIAPAIATSVRRIAVALAAACALLPLVHTASAHAATALPGLQGDGYIVPDAADHHVFVSGRPSGPADWNAPLYVMNEDGTLNTTLDVPGASGMALDGGVLYVLQCFSDQITTVDPATLTVTGTIPLGEASTYPCDLAVAGGRLWFPAPANTSDANLASVAIAAPHARVDTGIEMDDGLISHAGSDALVVFDTGTAFSMDASTATPTVIASRNFGTTTFDATMSPDGSLVTAAGGLQVMSMPSLADVAGFPKTGDAVAISGDDGWMATGDVNLQVTAEGAAAPLNTYPIRPRALAFAPDNSDLYVLVNPSYGNVSLETIVAPTLPRPQLTLAKSRRTSTAGLPVTLTATLSVADPAGVAQIWRRTTTGNLALVAQGAVGADRKFATVVRPKVNAGYVATFVPDDKFGPATSPEIHLRVRSRVTVKATGWYSHSGRYHLYHYRTSCRLRARGCPTFTATVLPNYAGKRVTFQLQLHVGGRWRTLGTVRTRLGRRSMATVHIGYRSSSVIGISARIRTVMPQQPNNLLGVSAWSYFRVTT